jgi:cytochrome c oxidase cbb3-type subunit 3
MSDPQHAGSNDPLDTGHDYDGIREYDNKLPNWWLATLFVAIIFGFGYWTYYHLMQTGSPSMREYRAEMKEASERAEALAKSRGAVTDELLVAFSTNPDRVESGAATFKKTCSVCHGPQGQGLIGPNLTDDYWLHGSHPTQILKTITGGVPDKGMPAWGPVLGEDTAETVAAYILTIKGKHVPGKAPQGVLETASNDVKLMNGGK